MATAHVTAGQHEERSGRFEQSGWLVLSSIPALASLTLLLFAYATSQTTGAWPTYNSPDPSSANSLLYVATFAGFLTSLPSIAALVIGLPLVRRLRLGRSDIAALLIGVAGFAVLILLWSGDLGAWVVD